MNTTQISPRMQQHQSPRVGSISTWRFLNVRGFSMIQPLCRPHPLASSPCYSGALPVHSPFFSASSNAPPRFDSRGSPWLSACLWAGWILKRRMDLASIIGQGHCSPRDRGTNGNERSHEKVEAAMEKKLKNRGEEERGKKRINKIKKETRERERESRKGVGCARTHLPEYSEIVIIIIHFSR